MRKLFRFKYEPCNGTCYAWCDVLPGELNKMPDEERKETVRMMVDAHSRLCDNPDYSFGVDMDSVRGLFVGHFRTPGSTELFSADSFGECVTKVCGKVLSTEIPVINGACTYGDHGSEDLGTEILRACTDEVYRKAHHDACPCHSNVA